MRNLVEGGREGIGAEKQMKEDLKKTFSLAIDTLRLKGTEENLARGIFKNNRVDGYIVDPNDLTFPAVRVAISARGDLENAKKVEISINGGIQGPSRLTLRKKIVKGQTEEVTGILDTWQESAISMKIGLEGSDNDFKILNGFSNAISKI